MTKKSKVRVIVVEPLKLPYDIEIDNNLESLQELVGGYIEPITFSPFEEMGLEFYVNEEGKINGLTPSLWMPGNVDVLAGPAVLHCIDEDGEEIGLESYNLEELKDLIIKILKRQSYANAFAHIFLDKLINEDAISPEYEKDLHSYMKMIGRR